MKPERLSILFVAAVLAHNFEEAVWLPGWSESAGGWQTPVSAPAFRLAATAISLLLVAVAALAHVSGPRSRSVHVLAGFAVAMVANVVFPHLIASVALRIYAPGTGTAVFLVAPSGLLLLRALHSRGYIDIKRMYWVAPLVTFLLLLSIPALFWVGMKMVG
ncbi:MAG: HXXEE domain-containing protein [Rhodanobacteraceae bacterium]|nr:HXXEE domain-containing protein [Rhodanobacteraceae bacterium]